MSSWIPYSCLKEAFLPWQWPCQQFLLTVFSWDTQAKLDGHTLGSRVHSVDQSAHIFECARVSRNMRQGLQQALGGHL